MYWLIFCTLNEFYPVSIISVWSTMQSLLYHISVLLCWEHLPALCHQHTPSNAPDICANLVSAFRLRFQQATWYFTYPDGAWLNPTLSLSAAFDATHPPGKIFITPTAITKGPGRDESVSGHRAEQAGKFRTNESKLGRKWFEYASVFLGWIL